MTRVDFDQQRRSINDELISIAHNIGVRKRELAVLEQRRADLRKRLDRIDAQELMRRHYGMIELIRLCRTPYWKFRPLDIDRIVLLGDNK